MRDHQNTKGVYTLSPNCIYKGEKRYAYKIMGIEKYRIIGVEGIFTTEEMKTLWIYPTPNA